MKFSVYRIGKRLLIVTVVAVDFLTAETVDYNGDPAGAYITEVTFRGGTQISSDNGSPYTGAHWVDHVNAADPSDEIPDGIPDSVPNQQSPDNVKSYPYSYHSTQRPKATAKFKLVNPHNFHPVWAKGICVTPGCNFEYEEKELINGVYPETQANKTIVSPRKIKCFTTSNRRILRNGAPQQTSLDIQWMVKFNGHGSYINAEMSRHTIYVTWGVPATALRQETLFNLSCSMADGQTATNAIEQLAVFKKIWDDFKDRDVKRMDVKTMQYWGEYSLANRNTQNANFYNVASLLLNADGVCQTWQQLLNHCTLCQSISDPKLTTVSIDKARLYSISGVTKNHSQKNIEPIFMLKHRAYVDAHTVPTVGEKLPGQGNPFPQVDNFVNHAFIRFAGRVYDPSYGTDYDSPKAWENGSLCALCIVEDTTPSVPDDIGVENWWIPNDPNSELLKYEDK